MWSLTDPLADLRPAGQTFTSVTRFRVYSPWIYFSQISKESAMTHGPHSPSRAEERFEDPLREILNGDAIDMEEDLVPADAFRESDEPRDLSLSELEELEAAGDLVTKWGYLLRHLNASSATICESIVKKIGASRKLLGLSQITAEFKENANFIVRVFTRELPEWSFAPDRNGGAWMVDEDGSRVGVKREVLESDIVQKGFAIVSFHGGDTKGEVWQISDRLLCCSRFPTEQEISSFLFGRATDGVGVDVIDRDLDNSSDEPLIEKIVHINPPHERLNYSGHPTWRKRVLTAINQLAEAVIPDVDRMLSAARSISTQSGNDVDPSARILNITARLMEIADEIDRERVDGQADVVSPQASCLERCLCEIERAVGLDEASHENLKDESGSAFDDLRLLSLNMTRRRFDHAMVLMDDLVSGLREEIGHHSDYAAREAMMLVLAAGQAQTYQERLASYNVDDPRLDFEIKNKSAARAFREAKLEPRLSVAAAMSRSQILQLSGIGPTILEKIIAEIEATGAPSVLEATYDRHVGNIDDRIRHYMSAGALTLDGKLGPKLRIDAALAVTAALKKSAYGAGGLRATVIDEMAKEKLHDLLDVIESRRKNGARAALPPRSFRPSRS